MKCRRSNGSFRAWFPTKEAAEAFAADPRNVAYQGDIPVLCMKIGCDGWHLSQPDWPDAIAAAQMKVN
jgi:thiamine monophosphate synthase